LLEPGDLGADGRLRHAKGGRSIGDGAMINDGAEGLEKTNIHESNKVPLLPAEPGNATVARSFWGQQHQPTS
jgi:hypothetical protein